MNIFSGDKIDGHVHVFDPKRFPYAAEAFYLPTGGETGTPANLTRIMDIYQIKHALLVGPNSGYHQDNSCLLDAIARGEGRFKGIAVVPNDVSYEELVQLKEQGVIGVAFNVALYGEAYYADTEDLLDKLASLDMFVQIQVINDQLANLLILLKNFTGKILIDHCGRPNPTAGINQPGFKELLNLANTGRAWVKLSGQYKITATSYPYPDMTPYIEALLREYTLDGCFWASDWPYLRAPERLDYGPLLQLVEHYLPAISDQKKLFWETPAKLFGFVN